MKPGQSIKLLILLLLIPQLSYSQRRCDNIPNCSAVIHQAAAEAGYRIEDAALKASILDHGRAALPMLVRLIKSEDRKIQSFAEGIVAKIPDLTREDLPLVLEALNVHNYAVASRTVLPALATIGKPHLIDLLLKTSSKPVRQQLILYLGSLGKLTDEEAGLIDDMATDDPETFTEVASEALHQARHPLAVKWMIRQIPTEKHKAYIYSKIGSYSEQAISAGPYLQEGLLQATDEYEKMTAVGSLVEIGYRPAIDTLIDVAAVTNDVELLYQIMLALWSFGDPKALSVIDAHREQHWLPFIRASAKLIGQAIREGEPFLQEPGKSFGYTYTYHFESIYRRTVMRGMARCGASDYPRYVSSEIKKYGYQGAPLTEFAISAKDETTSQEEQTRTPSVALHTPHGWLLGRNGGEFGGELITYRSAADYEVLKRINIVDFFTINDKVIALAHPIDLSPRESYLLELQYDGEWIIRKVARTPFWVRGAVLINETELFLYDFVEGVGFIMDDQYRFQAAECRE